MDASLRFKRPLQRLEGQLDDGQPAIVSADLIQGCLYELYELMQGPEPRASREITYYCKVLERLDFPPGLPPEPLQHCLSPHAIHIDTYVYTRLAKLYARLPDQDAEDFLLDRFRVVKPEHIRKTSHICAALAEIGTARSLPILVSYRKEIGKRDNLARDTYLTDIDGAFDAICDRMEADSDVRADFRDADFWKFTWTRPLEEFVGMVLMKCMLFDRHRAGGQPEMPPEMVDMLGDFFMEETNVDTGDITCFKDLRVCYLGEQTIAPMIEDMQRAISSELAMHSLLEDTGVAPNTEYLPENILTYLRIDYLTTRMRTIVRFADEGDVW